MLIATNLLCQKVLIPLPFKKKDWKARAKTCNRSVDAEQVQQQWLAQFKELKDPRGRQGCDHVFLSIVLIAILATIGGARGWEDIEVYAESHQAWLETFLDLKNGIQASGYL